ncbi:MAG: formylglycine-generating enzyme family protein [Cyanobium sp.]
MSASATRQAAADPGAASFRFLLSHRRRSQGFREALAGPDSSEGANAPSLTMLWIPPGRFWMGSPAEEAERSEDEGPQHLVQLQGFFLAQTPITQLQWRSVAEWRPLKGEEPWGLELNPEPSRFKGDQRPVETVSWHEAMEFCRRLSQRTGRRYTLPSEAQWEYACRAGTTTPFHFGETISSELANYDGAEIYGDGPKGEFRNQTTDVGIFPANAWGLHDMHGNVWEWCEDHWNPNYEGAPEDGRSWLDESAKKNEFRLLRGGSWYNLPRDCRSAFRSDFHPVNRYGSFGFRVCCLPQD